MQEQKEKSLPAAAPPPPAIGIMGRASLDVMLVAFVPGLRRPPPPPLHHDQRRPRCEIIVISHVQSTISYSIGLMTSREGTLRYECRTAAGWGCAVRGIYG